MKIFYNYSLTICLLIGIAIGGLSGIILGEKTAIVQPIGDLFLHMIFVSIIPLIFLSVASSIAEMEHVARLQNILKTVCVVFISTALISAIIALVGTKIYNPFQNLESINLIAHFPPALDTQARNIGGIIVNTLTVPDFPQLFSRSSLLPLIFFSLLFGFATSISGKKGQPIAIFLKSGTIVILRIIKIIMYGAPVGLGCYFATTVGHLGSQIIDIYLNAFLLYLLLTCIYFFGVNTIYAFISGGKLGIKVFWSYILTPSLTALSTSSSAACIPVNLLATKKMGVPNDIADAIIPLGANIHKDGSVMGGMMKIIFLFTLFHKDISDPVNIAAMISASCLVGAVMGGIPSGGMTGELMICSLFGFSPDLVGIIMIMTTIIDIPATLLNSTSNTACAMMVTRFLEGKGWLLRKIKV
ncbi:dicarboxylate/amino acid:cation symporter [Candidatus Profftia tarda]|uniref:Transporter, dicarboxylate/amino acid:cation Na+/H+ symporter family protein n=1 Tax=Candidatus Profftia tarda TaxID=1177216 RepID=A0A8E4EZ79_9ENTR|nr:cation:dicarboxylase symporter family transporter [Candidatus Profftia tarda]CAD6513080.1 Transporter, dicarboxylate/amino acid:cation Na+/H+ symporter family protein [Candidatus Profftia tarda]